MTPTTAAVVYCRPRGLRAAAAAGAVALLALAVPVVGSAWPRAASLVERAPMDVLSRYGSVCFLLAMLAVAVAALLYGAGPEELAVDLSARTYRLRRGFPLMTRIWAGPLDDVECVYLDSYTNKGVRHYQAYVGWRDRGPAAPGPSDLVVATSRDQATTRRRGAAAADRLGVSLLDDSTEVGVARRRALRRRRGFRHLRLVGLAGCVLIVLAFGPRLVVQHQLASQGRAVEGVVRSRYKGKSPRITYTYWLWGKQYRGSEPIASRNGASPGVGSAVQVTYLPAYPATSRTAYSNEGRETTVPLGLAFLTGLAVVVLSSRAAASRGGAPPDAPAE